MFERLLIVAGIIALYVAWANIVLRTLTGPKKWRDKADIFFSYFLALPVTLLTLLLPPFIYVMGRAFILWVIYG